MQFRYNILHSDMKMDKFSPNCSFPTTSHEYVEGPNLRSTTEIAWSCASIIIISTWSVLCLPVPPDVRPCSIIQTLRKALFLLNRKLYWMGSMLLFPEYLLSVSITNLVSCRVNHFRLQELAAIDKVQWELKHSMLADMGGIAIRFSEAPRSTCSACGQCLSTTTGNINGPAKTANGEIQRSVTWHGPVDHIEILNKQPDSHKSGFVVPCKMAIRSNLKPSSSRGDISTSTADASRKEDRDKASRALESFQDRQKRHLSGIGIVNWRLSDHHAALAANTPPCPIRLWDQNQKAASLLGDVWILDARQLILAREYNIIPSLPSVDDGEIEDKSKSDGLVRLLAILQVSWLAIQLVARRVEGVPPTPLEISTLAFSACAFVLYLVEWSKPKDVGVPFYIDTDVSVTLEAFQAIVGAAPVEFFHTRYYYMSMSTVHQLVGGGHKIRHRNIMVIFANVLATLLFSGIHLLAWDLEFPTRVESLLWKIAALTATLAPALGGLFGLGESYLHGTIGERMLPRICMMLFFPAFLISRIYLVVESVRSIFYLPPGAFVATWASNIPHFT